MSFSVGPTVARRYAIFEPLASGGMATVHLGRLVGAMGFSRTVAIKRLHPQFAKDPTFVAMFQDEARLAARIRHPNVVGTLDVVANDDELFVVLDYVHGASLSQLMQGHAAPLDPSMAAPIMAGVLHGLHAAHEAKNERGEPLELVHRDVSPQNVMVGVDGVARVVDFGVAKALGRAHTTRDGSVRGKLPYMAPEQLSGSVTRQSDVFSASVVLWELLTGRRLFEGDNEGQIVSRVLSAPIDPPTEWRPELPAALVAVTMRGLERDTAKRFATAREMAFALEKSVSLATSSDVGGWVESVARDMLESRANRIAAIEASTASDDASGGAELAATTDDGTTTVILTLPKSFSDVVTAQLPPAPAVPAAELPASRSSPKARRWATLVVLALVAMLSMAAFVGGRATSAPRAAAQPEPPAPQARAVVSAATTPEAPAPSAPASADIAAPIATAPATPRPQAGKIRAQGSRAPVGAGAAAPSASPARSSCDPPFTIGPNGEKIWKRECL